MSSCGHEMTSVGLRCPLVVCCENVSAVACCKKTAAQFVIAR